MSHKEVFDGASKASDLYETLNHVCPIFHTKFHGKRMMEANLNANAFSTSAAEALCLALEGSKTPLNNMGKTRLNLTSLGSPQVFKF